MTSADAGALVFEGQAALVAYLAHKACALRDELLSVQTGRVARIFTAAGPGFVLPGMTVEDIAAHVDKLMSTAGAEILPHALAEFPFFPEAR